MLNYYNDRKFTDIHNKTMLAMFFNTLSRVIGHENVSTTQRCLEGVQDKKVLEATMKTGVLVSL